MMVGLADCTDLAVQLRNLTPDSAAQVELMVCLAVCTDLAAQLLNLTPDGAAQVEFCCGFAAKAALAQVSALDVAEHMSLSLGR